MRGYDTRSTQCKSAIESKWRAYSNISIGKRRACCQIISTHKKQKKNIIIILIPLAGQCIASLQCVICVGYYVHRTSYIHAGSYMDRSLILWQLSLYIIIVCHIWHSQILPKQMPKIFDHRHIMPLYLHLLPLLLLWVCLFSCLERLFEECDGFLEAHITPISFFIFLSNKLPLLSTIRRFYYCYYYWLEFKWAAHKRTRQRCLLIALSQVAHGGNGFNWLDDMINFIDAKNIHRFIL